VNSCIFLSSGMDGVELESLLKIFCFQGGFFLSINIVRT